MADPGFLEGILIYRCTRTFRSYAHFRAKSRPFQSFLKRTSSLTSPINLFLNEFLLKYSKMSDSSSFLSYIARKGGIPFGLTSVYFLVLGAGVLVHPWIPLWICHCVIWRVFCINFATFQSLNLGCLPTPLTLVASILLVVHALNFMDESFAQVNHRN